MHIHHSNVEHSIGHDKTVIFFDVPTSSLPESKTCTCSALKKVSRVLARTYDAAMKPSGVNNTQFAVLRSIARHHGEPLVRVAEDLEMDRTSLYRAIAPMIREGWLASEEGADNRFKTARITSKGQRVFSAATKHWSGLQKKVIGKFGQQSYDLFLAELQRLTTCVAGRNSS
jgi:DNA-binding MarR family transcriptional regulator